MRVRIGPHADAVQDIPLEDYVHGSLLAEVGFSGLDSAAAQRVAQVQAILARTYALANLRRHDREGFDLCATTHCQLYRLLDSWPSEVVRVADEAVNETRGLVIMYDGEPINAVFHANCGGHTSDAQAVWVGHSPPYLQGAPDMFCLLDAPTPWRFELDVSVLRQALNRDVHTAVGTRLDGLVVTGRDNAGRAATIALRGEHTAEVRGGQLRAVLLDQFGPHSLRSTRFVVRRTSERVVFEGKGSGHGVGLCQAGAMARAREGHTPRTILAHYYPGTSLAGLRGSSAPLR